MSFDADRFYQLLPAVYRLRDADQGEPLKELLAVIAEQAGVLEEDLAQLYDDQFIETCADWVVPYIGDLIGCRALHGKVPRIALPRAEVANTIRYRRRKGTAVMLRQLAYDVTRWHAAVVEFFKLVGWTQHMNHVCPERTYAPNQRDWLALERLNSPFEQAAHTVDVRHISLGQGRYNIPNVGIFLWRLNAYRLSESPAFQLDAHRFLFSPLGNDTPLFTNPADIGDQITQPATALDVPAPISRRVLDANLESYYGNDKSLFLQLDGLDVDVTQIAVCDLSDSSDGWGHNHSNQIAVDPVLGRILLPAGQTPSQSLKVWFHYGFSGEIGGGEYERAASFNEKLPLVATVAEPATIQSALDNAGSGAIEITDNGRYTENLTLARAPDQNFELRASNGQRPTIILGPDMVITGGAEAEVTLNGLMIAGGSLRVPLSATNRFRVLRLVHCTLVPGISLSNQGQPQQPDRPSLILEAPEVSLEIDHCILGGIRAAETAQVQITDSIVDATAQDRIAFASPVGDGSVAGGALSVFNSTIIGRVRTVELNQVSNSILLAETPGGQAGPPVLSERRQAGCVRFSFVPLGSQTPRRYRCQPDLALAERARELGLYSSHDLPPAEATAVAAAVVPDFTDLAYGGPAYGQLSRQCSDAIRLGADDESEMGAFHHLYQPQREINLRLRLDEYLRFGLEAGIFYVT